MSLFDLGRLMPMELRSVWSSKSSGFTPWLAREDNLTTLGDVLSINLQLEAQEKFVGAFKADILCRDTIDDSWVLIENQLERTDHGHLGQLLTYAAGLEAVSIVWIARRFAEEHRAALDWLNRFTLDGIRFFGVERELWRIGESAPAPRFHLVAKPNDWSRASRDTARRVAGGSDEADDFFLAYWTAFAAEIERRKLTGVSVRPRSKYSIGLSIGRTGFRLGVYANRRDRNMGVELQINAPGSSKEFYRQLAQARAEIDALFPEPPEWRELPDQTRSRITCHRQPVDVADRDHWDAQHQWLAEQLVRFNDAFRERVRRLPVMPSQADLTEAEPFTP